MLSFGNASITLWEAIKKRGIYDESKLVKLPALTTEEEKLSGLAYMLRCCFAHGLTRPTWEIRHQRYKIHINKWHKSIDLSMLSGNAFTYEQIGGYETLWFIRDYMREEGLI
jgi:hypothetical protein